MSSFAERIHQLREHFEETRKEFGERINKSENTIYNWEMGNSEPYKTYYKEIAIKTGCNLHWLLTGQEKMFSDSPYEPPEISKYNQARNSDLREQISEDIVDTITIDPFISHVNDNFTKMNVFKRTGAGPEMTGVEFEVIDTVIIPRSVYNSWLMPFKVVGDSMEKIIMENSIVLVDRSPQELEDTKIYCFRIPYRGFVIRLIQKMPDALYLEPFNKQYEPKRIPWEDFDSESVIGRVVYNVINPFR